MDNRLPRSQKDILSENIIAYLRANNLNETEAAKLAGLKVSTLNSWIRRVSYPREKNLMALASAFGVSLEDLTLDKSRSQLRKRGYQSVGESELLRLYGESDVFREWVDFGRRELQSHRLDSYLLHCRSLPAAKNRQLLPVPAASPVPDPSSENGAAGSDPR